MSQQKREYLVHIPKGYDPQTPTPVVLALHGVAMNGPLMVVSQEQADALLNEDLTRAWDAVRRNVKVTLTQGQVDALTDFVFNLGERSLANSTLLRMINASKFDEAAEQFDRWVFAQGVKLPGLVTRRQRERELFEAD